MDPAVAKISQAQGKLIQFETISERDTAKDKLIQEFPELEKSILQFPYKRTPIIAIPAVDDATLARIKQIVSDKATFFEDRRMEPINLATEVV